MNNILDQNFLDAFSEWRALYGNTYKGILTKLGTLLRRENLSSVTVREFCKMSGEFATWRNVGKKSLSAVREFYADNDMKFGASYDATPQEEAQQSVHDILAECINSEYKTYKAMQEDESLAVGYRAELCRDVVNNIINIARIIYEK